MAATYAAEYAAIAAVFNTAWSGATPICWPNVEFTPPTSGSWVKFDLVDGDSEIAGIGQSTKLFRSVGRVMVNIYSPQNKGMAAALALADAVAAIFRNAVVDSNIRFKSPEVIQRGVVDGILKVHVGISFSRDSLL